MEFTNVSQAVAKFNENEATRAAYGYAMGVMNVDASTAAPVQSAEGRGRAMQVLSGVIYGLTTAPENRELVEYLTAHADELDAPTRRRVELMRKSLEKLSRIPQEEYVAYQVLLNQADGVWRKAKNGNDFAAFAPVLEQIVDYNRKLAGYYNADMAPYDALLNEYEEGLNMATLDAFFGQLRKDLVPMIHAIGRKAAPDDAFVFRSYPVGQQRKFSDYLMDVMGIDKERCVIAETEHPFTAGFNNKDVRLTTHYHENNVTSSLYSVIHEGGHALYELGIADDITFTSLGGGASMSIHESQSRFYENIIGRSRAFIDYIFPKMQEFFPEQLADVTAEQLYRAVNKAEPSLIRTEADELTYCMHIMVRYELEKQLIGGTLEVRDLPQAWNEMYREYLGIEVPDDAQGCLQDMHWGGGMFGYFPSYALGSAYGAQMLAFLEKDLGSIDTLVRNGQIPKVTQWLGEHIHRHGGMYEPGVLFENCCGKFDAKYYTEYLKKKYSELYEL